MLARKADIVWATASSTEAVATASALSVRGIGMAAWADDVSELAPHTDSWAFPVVWRFGLGFSRRTGRAERVLRNTVFGGIGLIDRFQVESKRVSWPCLGRRIVHKIA